MEGKYSFNRRKHWNFNPIKPNAAPFGLGDIPLEVAMLPDGGYVFSQSEVTGVVEKPEISIRRFLQSKRVKSIPGIASEFDTPLGVIS